MIGTVIGERYKLVQLLGGGGMSNVYLAEDTILERKVAVKLIYIPPNEKEVAIRRFEREVQNTTQLSNEHIVNVIDVGEDVDRFYLVMEYIEGPTLSEYIKAHGPLKPEIAIQFMSQILMGIQHAHENRIVHRDIKPHNILIDRNKTLKILDFGIAKAISETTMTETNHVLGTVQYLSPEQAKGESTDQSSDIYSMGIVLYEMLMGEPPFTGETAVSIAIKQIQDPVPNVTETRKDVPQALSNVILRATEKDKACRYPQAKAMYDDMQSTLSEARMHEPVYQTNGSATKTIPILKDDIKQQAKTPPKEKIDETTQIPIVNHSHFQSPEGNVYEMPRKRHSTKKKVLYALIVFILLAALFTVVAFGMFGEKQTDVPDILGKSEKQAESILKEKHLSIGDVTRDYSDKYQENEIMAVSPEVGSRIGEKEPVHITLSKGPKMITMPNVLGMHKAQALEKLKSLGLDDVKVVEAYSKNRVPKGDIELQSIAPGSKIAVNRAELQVTVSLGTKQVHVDDYVGESIDDARKALEAKGFKVVVDERTSDEDAPKGEVLKQSPKGQSVDEGSTIHFTVSKGKPRDDDSDKDEDKKLTKTYTQTVRIPYSGKNKKAQKVEVFIKDAYSDGKSPVDEFEIKSDRQQNIEMTVPEDGSGRYEIRVDGKRVDDGEVDYDDI